VLAATPPAATVPPHILPCCFISPYSRSSSVSRTLIREISSFISRFFRHSDA
jgi:hypothetical protein